MAEAKITTIVTVELGLTQEETHYLAEILRNCPFSSETVGEGKMRESIYKAIRSLHPIGET